MYTVAYGGKQAAIDLLLLLLKVITDKWNAFKKVLCLVPQGAE